MKIKKIFLLFSMITALFSLTACSNGQGEVNFDYKNTDVVMVSVSTASSYQYITDDIRAAVENEGTETEKATLANFDVTKKECGEFKGYLAKDEAGNEDPNSLLSLESIKTEEDLYTFLGSVYSKVEENGENVVVTLKAVYADRIVDFQFVYEAEPKSAYVENTLPFKLAEFTATPDYTFGEKMKKAGSNTLMGMGTVFIVLIFISIIIGQFEKLSKIGTKKTEKTEEKSASNVTAPQAVSANPMDDKQLVAVITAAVMAASGNTGSSDKLVVRSIRKAKR